MGIENMNPKTLHTECDSDGILTITINANADTMNVLNQQVMQEFFDITEDIKHNADIKAVIFISAKPDCFIAGADIHMLQQTQTAAEATDIVHRAHTLLQSISHSKKPFIAAINGVCLGAGYELSLACHYRIATNNTTTKIGLPEVMLGLLPGATGTTILSRLISLPAALDLMLTGKQLNAKRALRLGMIDEIAPYSILLDAAKKAAKHIIRHGNKKNKKTIVQRITKKMMSWPVLSHYIIYQAKKQVLKKTQGLYPAPLAILDVVAHGLHKPLKTALQYEAKRFGELAMTPQAKQLIHLYFATTQLKKDTFTTTNITPNTIDRVGIIGGGLMGAGIATVSIDKANVSVRIKDIHDTGLLYVHRHVQQYYNARVKRNILSLEHAKRKINHLSSGKDDQGFSQCDLVIEAVFEDINSKHKILNDIEALNNENIIFASNTSSIPISTIAAKAKRPENVIGMHYFSPVEKMPLLEIIKHPQVSDQTIATAVQFGRQQGKTVIVVNDGAGFYVNRILAPYINAALQLGVEGVPFDTIDNALVAFGFPVGPIKLLDEVGIDIGSKITPVLEAAFGERMKSCGIQQTLLDHGRLGKKANKGFYRYDNSKHKGIDESVYTDLNIQHHIEMDDATIVKRCLYPLLHEAQLCLQDNIINNTRDGDIGAIFGFGFPPFLGGPFRYMESMGIADKVGNNT